jgi:hypothetical protein
VSIRHSRGRAVTLGVLLVVPAEFLQPWRCLCRGFSQITITTPWRRITLHLSQIGLTLGLTFIVLSTGSSCAQEGNG